MSDVIERVAAALARMESTGREPAQLLIGNREAEELEASLYRSARTWRGLFGEVIAEDEELAPKLPLDMGPARLFDVPIKRVDQESLLGVVAEGYEE